MAMAGCRWSNCSHYNSKSFGNCYYADRTLFRQEAWALRKVSERGLEINDPYILGALRILIETQKKYLSLTIPDCQDEIYLSRLLDEVPRIACREEPPLNQNEP